MRSETPSNQAVSTTVASLTSPLAVQVMATTIFAQIRRLLELVVGQN
jgi:hypothetical protein